MNCKKCNKNPINIDRSKNYCTSCLNKALERTKNNTARMTPEQRRNRSHKYYIAHKDEITRKNKEYILAHPEIKKKSSRNYSKSHAKQIREHSKKYKSEHREHYNFLGRKWRERHPERYSLDSNLRRARINKAYGKVTEKEWISLCNEYGNRCIGCGRDDIKLTIDHVIPIVMGGSNSIDNIQPLCKSCNSKKATKIIDYRPYIDWT